MNNRPLLLAALVLLASPLLQAFAFSDVPSGAPYAQPVARLQASGVIGGYADGSFRPMQTVNRAEFLKMVMLARYGGEVASIGSTDFHCFTDFSGAEQWYWQYACEAKEKGVVTGNPDGSFRGETAVNLAEGLAMAMRAWGTQLPVYIRAPDHWYEPYIIAAQQMHAFAHVSDDPRHPLTRGEVAILLDLFTGASASSDVSVAAKCYDSTQCGADQQCSTEQGDCQSPCGPGEVPCIQVCAGVCIPKSASSPTGMSCIQQKTSVDQVLADEKNRRCVTDSDCTMYVAGCPLVTCGAPIATSALPRVQSAVDAYVASCNPGACAKCAVAEVRCQAGVCVKK